MFFLFLIPSTPSTELLTHIFNQFNFDFDAHHKINFDKDTFIMPSGEKRIKTSKSRVLLDLFIKISKDPRYWDKWWSSDQWLNIILAAYPDTVVFKLTPFSSTV